MAGLSGKVIAVTGAGSGIGRALAQGLAARGASLALADRDADGLARTRASLGNAPVHSDVFDVTEAGALARFAHQSADKFGHVDGIINNAGLSVIAPFEDMPEADFHRVMDVNFNAVVEGTRVFLPLVQESCRSRGAGWVVNISSVFGIMPYPTQTAYCASKFAVRGFTETLRVEQQMKRTGVQVMCVHPGGIKTNVARNAKFIRSMARGANALSSAQDFEKIARTTPEEAASVILRGMENGAVRVRIGADARLIDRLFRLMPVRAMAVLGRLQR